MAEKYYTSINKLFTTPVNEITDSVSQEIKKRTILLQFLGYNSTVSFKLVAGDTSAGHDAAAATISTASSSVSNISPNYVIFTPAQFPTYMLSQSEPSTIYPVRSSDESTPSLFNLYNNWNNTGNVNQFILQFNLFVNHNLYTEASDVVDYFLSVFFQNKTYNIYSGLIQENLPSFFPASSDPNYTPLLEKVAMFYNYSNNPTSGVGRPGGDYINSLCMNHFKNSMVSLKYNFKYQFGVCVPNNWVLPQYENVDYDWKPYLAYAKGRSNNPVSEYRTSVSTNDTLLTWCGCFTPPDQLLSDGINESKSLGNISDTTLCDPLCTNPNSIKRFGGFDLGGDDFNFYLQCKANVCIIDDVSIQSFDSSVPVTFTQVCPGCNDPFSTEACMCIINTDTSSDTLGKITNNGVTLNNQTTFNQVCPNAQCYIMKGNPGKLIQTPCSTDNTALTGNILDYKESGMTKKKYYNVMSKEVIIFLVLFFFVFILLILFGIVDFFKVYSIS